MTNNLNKPFVAIIILNYNRSKDLLDCIESLKTNNYPNVKIYVVDNNSRDDSVQRVNNKFSDVEIIESKDNLGYAGGMNIGIRYAFKYSPQYIMIMNSDTLLREDTIEILVRTLDSNLTVAIASGKILCYPDTNNIWYAGGKIDYFRASGFQNTKIDNVNDKSPKLVGFISGCAALIRTKSLKEVGLFDERFFLYLEDTELSARMIQKGYKLLYVPQAIIYHRLNDVRYSAHMIYYGFRNRFLFLEISAKGLKKYIGFFYLFITLLLKLIYWKVFNQEYYQAASSGIADYFSRKFSKGAKFH